MITQLWTPFIFQPSKRHLLHIDRTQLTKCNCSLIISFHQSFLPSSHPPNCALSKLAICLWDSLQRMMLWFLDRRHRCSSCSKEHSYFPISRLGNHTSNQRRTSVKSFSNSIPSESSFDKFISDFDSILSTLHERKARHKLIGI